MTHRQILGLILVCITLIACAAVAEDDGAQQTHAKLYDTDREIVLKDSDGDGAPDVTEQIAGTDPNKSEELPGDRLRSVTGMEKPSKQLRAPYPTQGQCDAPFVQINHLCIYGRPQVYAFTYHEAVAICGISAHQQQHSNPRVARYEDLVYVYQTIPWLAYRYNPNGLWLGNMVGDDRVLCGNRSVTMPYDPDIYNFEGTCNKSNERRFWCAYDLH